MARIVRVQTLAIKGKEFIEGRPAIGRLAPGPFILRHHPPNVTGVAAMSRWTIPVSLILAESFAVFLAPRRERAAMTSLGVL